MNNAQLHINATVGVEKVKVYEAPTTGKIEYTVYVRKENTPTDLAIEHYEVWFADVTGGTAQFQRMTTKYAVFKVWKATAIQQTLF